MNPRKLVVLAVLSVMTLSCAGRAPRETTTGPAPTSPPETERAEETGAPSTSPAVADYDPNAPAVLRALAEAYLAAGDETECAASEIAFGGDDRGDCNVHFEIRLQGPPPFLDVAFVTAFAGGTCGCSTSNLLVNTGARWVTPVVARADGSRETTPFRLPGPCEDGGTGACPDMSSEPRALQAFIITEPEGPRLIVNVEHDWRPAVEFPPLEGPEDSNGISLTMLDLLSGCGEGICAEARLLTAIEAWESIVDLECFDGRVAEGEGTLGAADWCGSGRTLVAWSLDVEPSPDQDAVVLSERAGGSTGRPPREFLGTHTTTELRELAVRYDISSLVQHAVDDSPAASTAGPPQEDLAILESGDAARMGDQCFRHLQARRNERARALCLAALGRTVDSSTEGAILFNLGRIAEASSARGLALRYYRRSLAARPANQVVQGRLDRLEASTPSRP